MMLARSLNNLESQDLGYEIHGRVLVAVNRPPASYTPEKLAAVYRDVEERLNRIPGVRGAGLALYNPLTDSASGSSAGVTSRLQTMRTQSRWRS
jgi:hypothetical protein